LTSHDEVSVSTGWKREALRLAFTNIQGKSRALPHFILSMIDVERTIVDDAEEHVVIADDELTLAKAHREASVATPAGLKKHDGPTTAHQVSDSFTGRSCCVDTRQL
jgi:hypothetical protein